MKAGWVWLCVLLSAVYAGLAAWHLIRATAEAHKRLDGLACADPLDLGGQVKTKRIPWQGDRN